MDPALASMFGLGGAEGAPAQATPEQPAGGGSDWGSFLSDPRARAGLISAGLQAMVGGYGNGIQQLGAALGAGAQGAGGMDKIIYDREQAAKELAQKASEGAATRAQSETNARIAADSRNEVAQTRTEGMLQRAALIHGPQNNQEMNIYSKAAADYMKKEKDNQLLSKKPDEQIRVEADAWAKSVLANARDASGVRSQGGALPTGGPGDIGGASSTGGPQTGGPVGPGGQGTPAGPAKASSTPTLDTYLNAKGVEADKFRSLIQTPAGQQQLLQIKPDLKPIIDEFNARWGPQQGSALGGAFNALKQNWNGALGQ